MPTPPVEILEVNGVPSKRCPKCSTVKPLIEFSKDRSKNCGKSVLCRACCSNKFNGYYSRNKEKDRLQSKKWRAENAERWRTYHYGYMRTIEGGFSFLKHQAKKRGLECDFSLETYRAVVHSANCYYCQGELNETGAKLDRKDSSIGYLVSNSVPCCLRCNLIRGEDNITYAEMIEVAKLLKELRKGALCHTIQRP
jgi:hypothetical protein